MVADDDNVIKQLLYVVYLMSGDDDSPLIVHVCLGTHAHQRTD